MREIQKVNSKTKLTLLIFLFLIIIVEITEGASTTKSPKTKKKDKPEKLPTTTKPSTTTPIKTTIITTVKPTTERFTTEPTTLFTTKPTTESTTKPTTKPTTESTMESTTELTTKISTSTKKTTNKMKTKKKTSTTPTTTKKRTTTISSVTVNQEWRLTDYSCLEELEAYCQNFCYLLVRPPSKKTASYLGPVLLSILLIIELVPFAYVCYIIRSSRMQKRMMDNERDGSGEMLISSDEGMPPPLRSDKEIDETAGNEGNPLLNSNKHVGMATRKAMEVREHVKKMTLQDESDAKSEKFIKRGNVFIPYVNNQDFVRGAVLKESAPLEKVFYDASKNEIFEIGTDRDEFEQAREETSRTQEGSRALSTVLSSQIVTNRTEMKTIKKIPKKSVRNGFSSSVKK